MSRPTTSRNRKRSQINADALIKKFEKLKPLFTMDDLQLSEEAFTKTTPTRRLAFSLGTKSGKELSKIVTNATKENDTDALGGALFAVRLTKQKMDAMQQVAAACEVRFITALCYRDDMQMIYAAADRIEAEAKN